MTSLWEHPSIAQKHRHHGKRQKNRANSSPSAHLRPLPAIAEKKPVISYGKPFIVLEDADKSTFIYKGGQWVPHSATIAECRQDCQVKELPQKIKGMTRYEICSPLPAPA